jgi:hypothetical protein
MSKDTCPVEEQVEVVDPTHPLFGRRFRLVAVTRALRSGGFARVEYRPGITMQLPLSVTSLGPALLRRSRPTKLTPEALAALVLVAGEREAACSSSPATFGPACPRPSAGRSRRTSAPCCGR